MVKSELISTMCERFPSLTARDMEVCVNTILTSISNSLAQQNRVEIRGFGSFDLSHRLSRLGRNPRTGKYVTVPEKYVPHFRAGKELRLQVDKTRD